MTVFLSILGFVVLGLTACGDATSPESTPDVTALINGKSWAGNATHGDTVGVLTPSMDTLTVDAQDSSAGHVRTLRLLIRALNDTGAYVIGGPTAVAVGNFRDAAGYVSITFTTDSAHGGVFHIDSLDTARQFLVGRFEFTAIAGYSASISVTNGRVRGHFVRQ